VSVVDIKDTTLTLRYNISLQNAALWCVDASKKEDIIVAGSNSESLYIISLSTREIKYHLKIQSGFYDVTIVDENKVFACPTASVDILVIDHKEGKITEWKTPRGKAFINAIQHVNSNVIVTADSQGSVTGFDPCSQQLLWTLNASDENNIGVSALCVFQNKIYAAVNTGSIGMLDSKSITLPWLKSSPTQPSYIRVWEFESKKHLYDIPISPSFISRIFAMDVAPQRIVIGLGEEGVCLIDLNSDEIFHRFVEIVKNFIY